MKHVYRKIPFADKLKIKNELLDCIPFNSHFALRFLLIISSKAQNEDVETHNLATDACFHSHIIFLIINEKNRKLEQKLCILIKELLLSQYFSLSRYSVS